MRAQTAKHWFGVVVFSLLGIATMGRTASADSPTNMNRRRHSSKRAAPVLAAIGIAYGLTIPEAAQAQITGVTTRPSGDTIQWGQLNFAPLTPFPTPQSFTSYGGIDGIIESGHDGNAFVSEQCCPGNTEANFAIGDLLFINNAPTQLTLSFKKPLKSVGTQIGQTSYGPFTAQIQAFDHKKLLGTFSENGDVTDLADNSAIFLGVTATTAEITSVVYTVTTVTGASAVMINQVTIGQ
jgi:hypothetical protein